MYIPRTQNFETTLTLTFYTVTCNGTTPYPLPHTVRRGMVGGRRLACQSSAGPRWWSIRASLAPVSWFG
jgi:hypothetical protein